MQRSPHWIVQRWFECEPNSTRPELIDYSIDSLRWGRQLQRAVPPQIAVRYRCDWLPQHRLQP